MMTYIKKIIKTYYRKILSSIAFYPVLISAGFLVFAIMTLTAETNEIITGLKQNFSFLFIQDAETSRTILSVLIGGIISLTVFSFSMVMVVLNQASANYSPRLLPGLISNRKNQTILGIYIGAVTYCIMVLTSLGAYGTDANNLGLSTMIAAILGVFCLGLFVYFIHNISSSIQIHNIIAKIFKESESEIDEALKIQNESAYAEHDAINYETIITCKNSGYYKGFDASLLNDSLLKRAMHIEIIPHINAFFLRGEPILKTEHQISEEEKRNLLMCFGFSPQRFDGNSSYSGMSKLMEVAIKALSPGINDPGTANDILTVLSPLLAKSLQLYSKVKVEVKNSTLVLVKNKIGAEKLMREIIQPIRHYGKSDVSILGKLIIELKQLLNDQAISNIHKHHIKREINAIKETLEEHVFLENDKAYLRTILEA